MRRRPLVEEPADLVPPADLLVPTVEVFCTAAELGSMDDGDLLVVTRRRWRDQREQWLEEHHVELRDQCLVWPMSRPRFATYDEPT